MKLTEIGEFGFIRRIRPATLFRPERIVRGIGDDAAAFRPGAGKLALVTTDLLVEGIHFLPGEKRFYELGWKALAVNLSDIAAMGGEARETFVAIAVPQTTPLAALDELYRGIGDLASRFQVNLLGGDTTGAPRDLVICITIYGEAAEGELLTRAGARPGDLLVVTGNLGESRAGLEILLGGAPAEGEDAAALLSAHRRPVPHLAEGRFFAAAGGAVHAAIDVSDGLGADLAHILEESGVGARVYAERLPVSEPLRRFCRLRGIAPAEYAFAGGEDYVLLAAVDPRAASALGNRFRERFGRGLAEIGEITAPGVREWIDETGSPRELAAPGWDHFRRS
ncbi:MAG: thiamine-phosphate kinase [Desulfobacterales bacterium]